MFTKIRIDESELVFAKTLISLMDSDQLWFSSNVGESFCLFESLARLSRLILIQLSCNFCSHLTLANFHLAALLVPV